MITWTSCSSTIRGLHLWQIRASLHRMELHPFPTVSGFRFHGSEISWWRLLSVPLSSLNFWFGTVSAVLCCAVLRCDVLCCAVLCRAQLLTYHKCSSHMQVWTLHFYKTIMQLERPRARPLTATSQKLPQLLLHLRTELRKRPKLQQQQR
jgi:hypothetical protein